MNYDIVSSIVLYKTKQVIVEKTIESFLNTTLNVKLYLIDNSPTDDLKCLAADKRIEYIFNGVNIGFGKAHNLTLKHSINSAKYHLILNPDVYFEAGTLETLFEYAENHINVGLVMPRVLNFENQLQFLCKRIPTPVELIFRRFLPKFVRLYKTRMDYYEMRERDYGTEFVAPTLSGCFMLVRTECLKKIGFFDERFFMYLEDVDLSRRIFKYFKNVYYPKATIYHGHSKESYQSLRLLSIHIQSAIKYFNKWGWFLDPERKKINKSV